MFVILEVQFLSSWTHIFHLELSEQVRVGGEVPLHRGKEPRLHEAGQPGGGNDGPVAAVAVVVGGGGGLVGVITGAVSVRELTYRIGGHLAQKLIGYVHVTYCHLVSSFLDLEVLQWC